MSTSTASISRQFSNPIKYNNAPLESLSLQDIANSGPTIPSSTSYSISQLNNHISTDQSLAMQLSHQLSYNNTILAMLNENEEAASRAMTATSQTNEQNLNLKLQNASLHQELTETRRKLAVAQDLIGSITQQCRESRISYDSLQHSNSSTISRFHETEKQLADAQILAAQVPGLQRAKAELQSSIDKLSSDNEHLRQEGRDARSSIELLRIDSKRMNDLINQYALQSASAKQEIAALEGKLGAVEGMEEAHGLKLSRLHAALQESTMKNEALHSQYLQANQRCAMLSEGIEKLEKEKEGYREVGGRHDALQLKYETLNHTHTHTQSELSRQISLYSELKTRYEECQHERDGFRREVEGVERVLKGVICSKDEEISGLNALQKR